MEYIFITGVSSGIGYASFKSLIHAGFHVIGSVRKESDKIRLESEFGKACNVLLFDVRDQKAMQYEIKKILPLIEKTGLKCLINNVGIAAPGPLQFLAEEDFDMVFDINVMSIRRITNLLLPYLGTNKELGVSSGKIINISSVSGLFNSPYNGAYCISKHALESMTDIYRRELSGFGIQVIAIEPGPIKTDIWRKNLGSLDKFNQLEYKEILSSANKMIENAEKSALHVSAVSDIILKIIAASKPKSRYIIHRNKFMFKLLAFWLPDKWADKLVLRAMAKKDNYRPV